MGLDFSQHDVDSDADCDFVSSALLKACTQASIAQIASCWNADGQWEKGRSLVPKKYERTEEPFEILDNRFP